LKTPPFPFTSLRAAFAAAIGYVLAEDHDGGVAPHFLVQRGVQ